jgi:hypothetical protein
MIFCFLTFASHARWVRSSKSYLIGLSLKDMLQMDTPIDNDYFNLDIRIVACYKIL